MNEPSERVFVTADGTELMQPPSRWLHRGALIAGVVMLLVGLWTNSRAGEVGARIAAVEATLQASAGNEDNQRALLAGRRDLARLETRWDRRTLGMVLAGAILLLGGFFGAGLRQLYDKRAWVETDRPPGG